MGDALADPRLRRLERIGVVLLLVAALVPRALDLWRPFDRGFDGFQGSWWAIGAVNYERLGVGTFGGYPVIMIDLPREPDHPPNLYANHSPAVPLLAWASVKLLGPEGWNDAWREGLPPRGIEGPLRLPFFLLHALGLVGLWWAVRQGEGPQRAFLALAVLAVLPVSILYAGLVNYENISLAPLLFGIGFHVRWLAVGTRRALVLCAALFALAAATTFPPLFFVPPMVVQTLLRRGWRRAVLEGLVVGGAALAPIVLHGLWVRRVAPHLATSVWERGMVLVRPLLDGSAPLSEWMRRQWVRLEHFAFEPILWLACAGLALSLLAPLLRRRGLAPAAKEHVPIGGVLLASNLVHFLAFYQHTWDGDGAHNGQTFFLLNAAPTVAVLAACALDTLDRALLRRLRAGFAPLVLVVLPLALAAHLGRTQSILRAVRAPGPRDDPAATEGPATPLPSTAGPRIAELLPPGSVGFFPIDLGFTPAVQFYAWRTLMGFDERTLEQRLRNVDQLGLGSAPCHVLLPVDPPPQARAFVERWRPRLAAEHGEPVARNRTWEAWPVER